MFRTARGFLLVAPGAFFLALVAFLVSHPKAAEAFTPYAFMADAIGQTVSRSPIARFVITAIAAFLLPYLAAGMLLFFADLGVTAAGPLWRGKKSVDVVPVAPESRVTFLGASAIFSIWAGASLHRVAHGGELPGGVNLSPVLVVGAGFAAMAAALGAGALVGLPRTLWQRFGPGSGARMA
jgi:hypothetical protein